MPKYSFMRPDSGSTTAFLPTVGSANWVLECIVARQIRLTELWWGGEDVINTQMRTRISRDSAVGTGARTAISSDRRHMSSAAAPGFSFISSAYVTTPPTISNASLFGTAWTANGGQTVVFWQAGPGDGFQIAGAASIECRADVGGAGSTYGGAWEED